MPELSEWLKLMLAEIARKHDESEHAQEEQRKRVQERNAQPQEHAVRVNDARTRG
jgi:hypothetical protein